MMWEPVAEIEDTPAELSIEFVPVPAMRRPIVAGLYVYPVSFCGGIFAERAVVTPLGLQLPGDAKTPAVFDHQWCICDSEGFVQDNQSQPGLASVRVSLADDSVLGGELVLSSSSQQPGEELRLPLAEEAYMANEPVCVRERDAQAKGRALGGHCAGAFAGEWVTKFLQRQNLVARNSNFRLVRISASAGRAVDRAVGGAEVMGTACPKATPYHLVSIESLADSHRTAPELLHRSRPSILVRGVGAYEEEHLRSFALGANRFRQIDGGFMGASLMPELVECEEIGIWAAPEGSALGGEVRVGVPLRRMEEARL